MSERVLNDVLYGALAGDIWGSRVAPEVVPAGTAYPYVVWWIIGGGEVNDRRRDDAIYMVGIKCVSDTHRVAITGQDRIGEILNNSGGQDGGAIMGQDGWAITTITRETVISLREAWRGAKPIYHKGHQFEIVMEKTNG